MKYALNKQIADNYAFYDPESGLHLTKSLPVATTTRETSGIRRGIASKVILSLDEPKAPTVPVAPKEPTKDIVERIKEEEAEKMAAVQEEAPQKAPEQPTEAVTPVTAEEPAPKKKGGKKATTATEE